MPGLVESRTFDSLLSTTLANFREQLIDNIFDSYPLLSFLGGDVRLKLGQNIKRVIKGGESIVEHLMYGQNDAVKAYSGYELLDTTPQEGITIARFNWKQYSVPITISGLERRSNSSKEALVNMLASKVKQSELSLKDRLSRDAYSDGSGSGGKEINGLQNIVSDTAISGSLDPATHSWWKADVTSSAGSFAANGLSKMRTTYNNISRGNDKPDILLTTQSIFEYYEAALQPQERFANSKLADAGFQNLAFKGVGIVFDRDCPSGKMYFLNSKYINFTVHSDANFTTTPMIRRDDQDSWTSFILLQANMTTNNRRNLGLIEGFTA